MNERNRFPLQKQINQLKITCLGKICWEGLFLTKGNFAFDYVCISEYVTFSIAKGKQFHKSESQKLNIRIPSGKIAEIIQPK